MAGKYLANGVAAMSPGIGPDDPAPDAGGVLLGARRPSCLSDSSYTRE